MGIPSYFSYIIQNHPTVLRKYSHLVQENICFARLYLDCNSILYDCYRQIPLDCSLIELETLLLEKTAMQIQNYILQLQPHELVYIAFDGVAPTAKMEQQRNRRYKSWFETTIMTKMEDRPKADVYKTTSMFTPGTLFMKKLSIYMKNFFKKKEKKYHTKQIIVTTPDEAGEGEHKLFAHLRDNPTLNPCAIYGLDADLMMLSICNLQYCSQIYIFRESPQFAKTILAKTNFDCLSEDEPLFIDMGIMSRSISAEMQCEAPHNFRMFDYVFLCFFLGNDFLPHFPSLNIRTLGISALLDSYQKVIGSTHERYLLAKHSTGFQIQWKEVYRLIRDLASKEESLWKQEYAIRSKWDKKPAMLQLKKTAKEKVDLFQNTPVMYRKEEKYINPYQEGWESRYYDILFPSNGVEKDSIIRNYLEGIEWVTQYYFNGMVDWSWKYLYHYPPLLKHLEMTISNMKFPILPQKKTKPVSAFTQLQYVLPPIYHHLLPKSAFDLTDISCTGLPLHENGLPNLEFQWAFCRYFWECHVKLPS